MLLSSLAGVSSGPALFPVDCVEIREQQHCPEAWLERVFPDLLVSPPASHIEATIAEQGTQLAWRLEDGGCG
jgi:hypothetical protein